MIPSTLSKSSSNETISVIPLFFITNIAKQSANANVPSYLSTHCIAVSISLKVGKYIVLGGEACKIISYTTSSPGKHGAAKARLEAVGIFDGQKRSLVKPVDTKVEVPILDKRIGQILAIMGDQVQIMDLETFETMELAIPDEFADDIRGAVGTDLGVEYIVAMGNMKIMRTKKV